MLAFENCIDGPENEALQVKILRGKALDDNPCFTTLFPFDSRAIGALLERHNSVLRSQVLGELKVLGCPV